jgi:hypothetical protein
LTVIKETVQRICTQNGRASLQTGPLDDPTDKVYGSKFVSAVMNKKLNLLNRKSQFNKEGVKHGTP